MTALRGELFSSAGATARTADAPRRRAPSTFWFGFWLAVVLVGCKLASFQIVERARIWPNPHTFRDANIATNADLLFAVAVSLAFQAMLVLTAGRRIGRLIWGTWIIFCILAVLYAILSVQVFKELRSPLTYPLLSLSRNVKGMRSSLAAG